jgi:hypothetical protein
MRITAMHWIWISAAALAFLAVLVVVIGALLPRRHLANRRALISADPAAVYAAISDVARAASWRPDVQRVRMLDPVDGKTSFLEEGANGSITYVIDEAVPGERFVTRIADESLPFGGSWTFVLLPEGGDTRITITEDGVVRNPLFRFMSRFVFGHHANIDQYLAALTKRFPRSGGSGLR